MCNMGLAPCPLRVLPPTRDANVLDSTPMLNVGPFGMCQSPANPVVMGATAASHGVLTPMPCVPGSVSAWIPGDPLTLVENVPALTRESQLICSHGGVIRILPG